MLSGLRRVVILETVFHKSRDLFSCVGVSELAKVKTDWKTLALFQRLLRQERDTSHKLAWAEHVSHSVWHVSEDEHRSYWW